MLSDWWMFSIFVGLVIGFIWLIGVEPVLRMRKQREERNAGDYCPGCGKKMKISSMDMRHEVRRRIGAHENNMTIHFMHKLLEKLDKLTEDK